MVVKAQSFKDEFVASSVVRRSFYIIDKDKGGLDYRYFEGMWNKLPDFSSLTEKSKGRIYAIDLTSFDRRNANFAAEFFGYIKIEKGGKYNFFISSNDGSRLYIGDILVVDNDGVHGDFEKQGQINLKPGMHPIKIEYFDGGGIQALQMQYKGPGVSRQTIPADKLMCTDK
jgi:hypothetical protein